MKINERKEIDRYNSDEIAQNKYEWIQESIVNDETDDKNDEAQQKLPTKEEKNFHKISEALELNANKIVTL